MVATPSQTPSATSSEDQSDELIRQLMTEQKRVHSRNSFPDLEPPEEDDGAASGKKMRRRKTRNPGNPAELKGIAKILHRVKTRVTGYRPTVRHMIVGALILVVWFRPFLIPGLLFVMFCVGFIVWLTLGPDRVAELAGNGWQRLALRHPKTVEKLRSKADRLALRFDALLDRLPDRWAEKLALPDFSQASNPEGSLDDQPDPFERLKTPEVYRG